MDLLTRRLLLIPLVRYMWAVMMGSFTRLTAKLVCICICILNFLLNSDDVILILGVLTNLGSVKWKLNVGKTYITASPAIAEDGSVLIGTADGFVYMVSAAGGLPCAQ